MNLSDILVGPPAITTEKWHFGHRISRELKEGGLALIFCSDYRGTGWDTAEVADFTAVREVLYRLSALDFEVPVCDLGDLVSGKTHADTHYILQELVMMCLKNSVVPLIIGGGNDLAFALFSALNCFQKDINYTQISSVIALDHGGDGVTEHNFLAKILSSKDAAIRNYHHLGYQKHLNELDSVKLMQEVNFDVIRLAEMMNTTEAAEPFFRQAHLTTVNCDAVESFAAPFSVHPQVNGLNRREICAYMKEVGMSSVLRATGIFNYNVKEQGALNAQLLAQMIWHLAEGLNVRRTHPQHQDFETFFVMADDRTYAFRREVFTGLWYFAGEENDPLNVPCSRTEYNLAASGTLPLRLMKYTS